MGIQVMMGFLRDPSIAKQKLTKGTVARIATYAKPYKWLLVVFLVLTAVDALITVVNPLLLKYLIDDGILGHETAVVLTIAGVVAGLAVFSAVIQMAERFFSARIGEGLIYDLRTQVFRRVQRQPIAFFIRTQTGNLVSRLNSDVIGAQRALTDTLSSVVANVLQLALVLAAMFYLSWLVTVVALATIPLFILPTKLFGRRMQGVTREGMQLDAEMGSMMNERFNVAGAVLVKLYGRPREEAELFGNRAARVRDIGVVQAMYTWALFTTLTMVTSLAIAAAYGLGGTLVIHRAFQLGTLVALTTLLMRLYGPITALSNVPVNLMTALVSFDRVFEVLDLRPMVSERPGAVALSAGGGTPNDGAPANHSGGTPVAGANGSPPEIEFDQVSFHYPAAEEVSLASLESIARPGTERGGAEQAIADVTFTVRPGQLAALVGPSGAGKTTIAHLVARLYDPSTGTVRIGGHDLRDVTLDSLRDTIGVVTQDAHLFHDTIRANLAYARPTSTEEELVEACRAAQIWGLISTLPDGLDTVVGDRGYRLSGGEKQRLAIARLLLKGPSVVILDEATAHLDSESEAAVQRALKVALSGRTSVVIAHRLSTVREASQILVLDQGRIRERGTHVELLAAGGLYAALYRTQFANQESATA